MPVKRSKGAKNKADKLFSLIIRSKMACERCGAPCPCPEAPKKHTLGCPLTTSHIVGRTTSHTRTMEANAQALCFKCHAYFTDDPVAFTRWLESTIGLKEYDRLRVISNAGIGIKFDWDAEVDRLDEVWKNILANA